MPMQATYAHEGDTIDYTPGADVSGGTVVVIGGLVGLASTDIPANTLGALQIEGAIDFAKASAAVFAVDDVAYWDATAGQATLANTGVRLGRVIKAAGNGTPNVRVKLASGSRSQAAVATVAAAGSTQADAAALADGFNVATGADGTKGVLLPTATPGRRVEVKNAAGAILKIWPAAGDGVNALAVNAAFSIAANTSVILTAVDATTWYSIPLLPS